MKVWLDDQECNITEIGTTVIICHPHRPETLQDEEPPHSCVVSCGNQRVNLVKYSRPFTSF